MATQPERRWRKIFPFGKNDHGDAQSIPEQPPFDIGFEQAKIVAKIKTTICPLLGRDLISAEVITGLGLRDLGQEVNLLLVCSIPNHWALDTDLIENVYRYILMDTDFRLALIDSQAVETITIHFPEYDVIGHLVFPKRVVDLLGFRQAWQQFQAAINLHERPKIDEYNKLAAATIDDFHDSPTPKHFFETYIAVVRLKSPVLRLFGHISQEKQTKLVQTLQNFWAEQSTQKLAEMAQRTQQKNPLQLEEVYAFHTYLQPILELLSRFEPALAQRLANEFMTQIRLNEPLRALFFATLEIRDEWLHFS